MKFLTVPPHCRMKIPPLSGMDAQIVNSNKKQLIWPSIPHGVVILLTNQLEMISHGPPGCPIGYYKIPPPCGITWIFGNFQVFSYRLEEG